MTIAVLSNVAAAGAYAQESVIPTNK